MNPGALFSAAAPTQQGLLSSVGIASLGPLNCDSSFIPLPALPAAAVQHNQPFKLKHPALQILLYFQFPRKICSGVAL